MTAWSLARAEVRDSACMLALAHEAVPKIQEFSIQGLTKTASAFALLEVHHNELLQRLAKEAIARVDEFPAQGLADLAWSYTALRMEVVGLAQALADAPGWHECPPYNHSRQAGSVADCFKHVVLIVLFRLLLREGKPPLTYVDTHAGGGVYDLSSIEALQDRHFEEGIAR